ncbi:hypothetical protein FoTM2_002350 [Fusarium oxysporum f. sp. vasinfectum]|nr:hypothetical protein FoTM2_002350 [Fusarium oxysporum f. sp. vasinfectum]
MSSAGSTGVSPERTVPIFAASVQAENSNPLPLAPGSKEAGKSIPAKKNIAALSTSKLANQGLPKKMKLSHDSSTTDQVYPVDKFLAKLSEQQSALNQQNDANKLRDETNQYARAFDHASSSNSLPVTPATDAFPSTAPTTRPASATLDEARSESEEVMRLKLQLAQAQNEISKLDQELAETRVVKTTADVPPFGTRGPVYPPSRECLGPS